MRAKGNRMTDAVDYVVWLCLYSQVKSACLETRDNVLFACNSPSPRNRRLYSIYLASFVDLKLFRDKAKEKDSKNMVALRAREETMQENSFGCCCIALVSVCTWKASERSLRHLWKANDLAYYENPKK